MKVTNIKSAKTATHNLAPWKLKNCGGRWMSKDSIMSIRWPVITAWGRYLNESYKGNEQLYVVYSYTTPVAFYDPAHSCFVSDSTKYSLTTNKQVTSLGVREFEL